jgi:Spy/CpxP family protein refolding chaperone
MRTFLLAGILAFGVLSPPAQAGEAEARFEEVAAQVGLTAPQKQAIVEILYKSRLARIDVKARLDRAELDLRHALSAATLDEKAVKTALDAVTTATADLQRNRVDQIVAIRRQLNGEQWEKLKIVWREDDRDEDDRDKDDRDRDDDDHDDRGR